MASEDILGCLQHSLENQEQACVNAQKREQGKTMFAKVLCVALQPVNMPKEEVAAVAGKEQQGVRFTGLVVRSEAGWTSIQSDTKQEKGDGGKKQRQQSTPSQKLCQQVGDIVLMHSYDLKNKAGVYTKTKRSDHYAAIMPGMVLTFRVWGDKLAEVCKNMTGDIALFDSVEIELSMKSLTSTSENMKLELKRFIPCSSAQGILNSSKVLPMLPSSLEESQSLQRRFASKEGLPEDLLENMQQDMIKGHISQTVHLLSARLTDANGLFAVQADGAIKFHVQRSPVPELAVVSMHVKYDKHFFGSAPVDWVAKILNAGLKMQCVQGLLLVDTYRTQQTGGSEVQLEAFVRFNTAHMLQEMVKAPVTAGELIAEEITAGFKSQGLQAAIKHLLCYDLGGVQLVVDTRKMVKKGESSSSCAYAVVHPSSAWSTGHMLHVFYKGQSVHSFVFSHVSACGGGGNLQEMAKRALEPTPLCDFEAGEVEYESVPEPPQKKGKTAAAAGKK